MGNFDELLSFLPQSSGISASRRRVLLAPLVAAMTFAMARTAAQASTIDPTQTIIILPDAMRWVPWSGLPPHSGEMATLYGASTSPDPISS